MNWKEQLDKAIDTLKQVAESDTVKGLTAKAKDTASKLAQRAKSGALGAAEAFVEANSDPAAFKVRYLHADVSVVSPSDGIEVTRPSPGSVVICDGAGNGSSSTQRRTRPMSPSRSERSRSLAPTPSISGQKTVSTSSSSRIELK